MAQVIRIFQDGFGQFINAPAVHKTGHQVIPLELIIHCGLDKAGSTAIQAHVALFRPWLLRHSVYVPSSGLSGFGHVALFRDLDIENWQPLLDELDHLEQQDFTHCFLSYEGICFFDAGQLARIKAYLTGYKVTVLFYLREQAEIIQSGYLQGLKATPNPVSISHLNGNHALLFTANRDYSRLLEKFQSVFGREAIAARLYQPEKWRNGSIVWDLLEFMACPPDNQFTPAAHKQNISLDVQSAFMLNVFDSWGENGGSREALVEDLLWLIRKYPGGTKYFLDEAAVQHIRDHYRSSNAVLAARHGVEFNYRECSVGPQGISNDENVSYIAELAKLARYPRWKGEQLEGLGLAMLLEHSMGWSQFESWGVWSEGEISHIAFRLPLARFSGFEDSFTMNFRGRYLSSNKSTQIWINGNFIDTTNLSEAAVKIPLRLLDENRVAHLELRHQTAKSDVAPGAGSGGGWLVYGLQSLNYLLAS